MRKILLTVIAIFCLFSFLNAYDKSDLEKLLKTQYCIGGDLSDADLEKANLEGADLSNADLPESDLTKSNLKGGNIQ
ncbi:MAG TPA: hypothetical protein DD381_09700 [Lentisphaeria bacterium]|nr:MAG: hypothetical protein A2X47_07575 [Lentisphaerae bacterium GWF2_38_69]HBM16598.1 hypothetical protein [Lentisphaeria bacterium]